MFYGGHFELYGVQFREREEVIKILLKDRDNEEFERLRKRNCIVIHNLPESTKISPEDQKKEDIKNFTELCRSYCKINFAEECIAGALRLGKKTEGKERPLLISLMEKNKRREITENYNKIREAPGPFNKVLICSFMTRDVLAKKLKLVKEAKEMTLKDDPDKMIFVVRGPPWNLRIVREKRKNFSSDPSP